MAPKGRSAGGYRRTIHTEGRGCAGREARPSCRWMLGPPGVGELGLGTDLSGTEVAPVVNQMR